jgi:two-component system OmpR family sensor kinase
MNRHSILFKLNILFTIALLATLIAAFSIALHSIKKDNMALFFKSRLIVKEMRTSGKVPVLLLKEFHFREVKGNEKKEVLKEGTIRTTLVNPMQEKMKNRILLTYQGHRYLHLNIRGMHSILLEDQQTFMGRFFTPLLVFAGIITLLILMYTLLRRSLIPLKKLEEDIVKYGEGELKEYTYLPEKDEISLASNAFYHSVEKVRRLTESRQLFIRNLFHELNTPVTKGKILAELVEEPKTQKMLDSIFTRLSTLLKELAKVEKITSENYTVSIKPVRIIELMDEASDLLYLDEKIKTNVTNEMIEADFSSMSIVFKNLIDNALKYGDDLEIIYSDDTISFVSGGEALKKNFSSYTEAFSKGKEPNNEKGFGLGLYIVNEIIHEHKMHFDYEHKNGKNRFTIHPS